MPASIEPQADLVSVADWLRMRNQHFFHFDGVGRFVRDGAYTTVATRDDVFGVIPDNVTHIAWINRWKNSHPIGLAAVTF